MDNEHRFKDDPRYGKWMKKMWEHDLAQKVQKTINETKVVGKNGLTLPPDLSGHMSYATPTNHERDSIAALNFRKHVLATHPPFQGTQMPP